MIVRAATPDDLAFASDLLGQLNAAHGEVNQDQGRLDARAAEVLAICDCYVIGDPPAAFASLQDAGDYMTVRHFVVDQAHRGNGTGRAAFTALENHAFPGRKSRLFASLTEERPKAFWEAMGYSAFAYTMERKPEGAA